jgi:TolB-like protein/Tfp pilus assembly protein PilF
LVLAAGGVVLLAGVGYLFTSIIRRIYAPPTVRALAVLPLKNISGDPAIAQGLTEAIVTELNKTGLTVIAWQSVSALRPDAPLADIRGRLHVEAVIRGSVLQSDKGVRIDAQLIDTRTGRVLSAESFQRESKDALRLLAEVASVVARRATAAQAIKQRPGAIASTPREVVPEAYQSYLRGRFFWNKRTEAGLRKAVEYFDEAIAKDPTYAPAYAGRADSLALLGSNSYDAIPPLEAMPEAKRAAQLALELDPELAEAHTSLAYIMMVYDWNLDAAEREFQKALASNPGYATARHWHAHCLLAAGKVEEASAEMGRALSLDPNSLPVNVGVGWCLYFARRYDEAIRQYRMTLELEPNFALAHQTLGMALLQKHNYPEAITEFQTALRLSGGESAEAAPSTLAYLGYAYGLSGATANARNQLARLAELSRRRYVPAIYTALVYLGLSDRPNFSLWFSKAREERSEYLIYYQRDPAFGSALAGK